uniref:Uncharacterized protein n=1 Tax=Pipistrellus kuhlii TaxID=59472 RepID=A0A7J7ZKY7_PIPKU|nr:hypothetical protein mPipKuh1_009599 [Pipistrellus kuhlii]
MNDIVFIDLGGESKFDSTYDTHALYCMYSYIFIHFKEFHLISPNFYDYVFCFVFLTRFSGIHTVRQYRHSYCSLKGKMPSYVHPEVFLFLPASSSTLFFVSLFYTHTHTHTHTHTVLYLFPVSNG